MTLNGNISRTRTLNGSITPKGADGRGIVSIAKTATAGLVDTYTITYTDGSTSTFTITNGANGEITAASFAAPFSASTAYAAGDYVVYSGQLYQFTTAHAAGAWTGSDATAVQLANEVHDLKSQIATIDGGGLDQEEKQTIYDLFKSAAYSSADAAANVLKLKQLWNIEEDEEDVDPSELITGVTFVSRVTINTNNGDVVPGSASTYVSSEIDVSSLAESCISVIFGAASSEHRVAYYDANHNNIYVMRINASNNTSLLAGVPDNAVYMRLAGVLTDNTINLKYFPASKNLVTSETMLPSGQYINPSNGAIAYGSNEAAKFDVESSTEYTLANIASGATYNGDTFAASIAYQASHIERTVTTGANVTKMGVNKVSTELFPMGAFKSADIETIGTLTVEV